MESLEVWAPYADTVQARINGQTMPMHPLAGSWWRLDARMPEGTDYAFILDGGKPLPDPRSARQPRGVHGPSQRVDHAAFDWHDAGWQPPPLSSAVIYELHVGTFSHAGTFAGVVEHLDHLSALGVTHLELMPVNSFSGRRGWGYDGVSLYAPQESYGGPEGLKRLVDVCHGRGLSVILDVVYNHLGPEGNYLTHFGPYLTDRYQSPWGQSVNLDGPESHEVRRFFRENALMWLRDYHMDGLRIDAVHALVDLSALHFLEELADAVKRLESETGRHRVLIAESDLNEPRIVRQKDAGGFGIDGQWSDDFHHALHCVLTGEKNGYYADFGDIADLVRAFKRVFVYDGKFSAFRRRIHGRSAAGLPATRFIGYLQNHDQIGNRALGERAGHLMNPERLRAGAAIVFFAPFVPMLFQGEEWGASTPFLYFTDHGDSELGEAVRSGRCEEFAAFGWDPETIPDPQAHETFARSILNWDECAADPHQSILQWFRQIIDLRKRYPDLTDGRVDRVRAEFSESGRWLVITRGRLVLACNLGKARQLVPIAGVHPVTLLLCSAADPLIGTGGIALPPDSAAILRRG